MEPSSEPTPWQPRREPLSENNGWRSPESVVTFELPREPETAPQGQRLGPPSTPPAPPGTAGGAPTPEDGSFERNRFGNAATIVGVLSYLATVPGLISLISNALEAVPPLGEHPSLQQSLLDMVRDQRNQLAQTISELQTSIEPEANRYLETDLHAWRQEILRLIIRGASREAMDTYFEMNLFARVEADRPASGVRPPSGHFSLRTRDLMSPARAGMVPAGKAARLYLDDLLQDVRDPKNYKDRQTFEKQVGQKALALIYAAWLAHLGTQPKSAPELPPTAPRRAATQEEVDAIARRLLGDE